jgi:hypothetical protein
MQVAENVVIFDRSEEQQEKFFLFDTGPLLGLDKSPTREKRSFFAAAEVQSGRHIARDLSKLCGAFVYDAHLDIDLLQKSRRFALILESELYFKSIAASGVGYLSTINFLPQKQIRTLDTLSRFNDSLTGVGGIFCGVGGDGGYLIGAYQISDLHGRNTDEGTSEDGQNKGVEADGFVGSPVPKGAEWIVIFGFGVGGMAGAVICWLMGMVR